MESEELIQTFTKMDQLNQNFKISDLKDMISTVKNLVSQMRTDLLQILPSIRNITSNISNNGNKRDLTDQLLNISMIRDTSMMLH